jgi:hypothetical protein
LIDFLNKGKGLYVEGTTFGYNNVGSDLYNMFGIKYSGPGTDDTNNLDSLFGQNGTFVDGKKYDYLANSLANHWVGEFGSEGGRIFFKCDKDKGRGITYEGPDKKYRAIHTSVLFGAIRDNEKRNELMEIYMEYLLGNTPFISEQYKSLSTDNFLLSHARWDQEGCISFILLKPSWVKISFYSVDGRLVRKVMDKKLNKGFHQYYYQAKMSSGRYIASIENENKRVLNIIKIIK